MTNTDGCFPTPTQELLLRAALLKGEESIAAWQQWYASVNLEDLDQGSYRLLPLLYRNLHGQGVVHPEMNRLKGVYRRTLYKNQLLFHKIAAVVGALQQAGIATMALKGAALIPLYYRENGLRPMLDFDLLVPTVKAGAAIQLLKEQGWTPMVEAPHAQGFKGADQTEFDLHWHMMLEFSAPDADDDFWCDAVTIEIQGLPVFALNAADQLLHICAHGAQWNRVPPLRWVADAMMILNSSAEVDWQRLLHQARKRRLILPMRETLMYLQNLLQAPIPAAVSQHLEEMPVSKIERLDYRSKICPHEARGPALTLWAYYREYLHWANNDSLPRKVLGFPAFLKNLWGLESLWQVPFSATSGLLRRTRRALR